MSNSPEQLDELIRRIKKNGDVSSWQKNPSESASVNLVSIIANIPKAQIPQPNLLRVRNKILDRISLPGQTTNEKTAYAFAFLRYVPRFMRITGGIVGGFAIFLSLTIGTAVAALDSVPGETIYPVKKIVENVRLKMAHTEEQKANLQIKFANNRVDELETILKKQKEGKVSDAQVQKVVADITKDIEKTTKTVTDQSKNDPNVNLLSKIVTLSNKQVAVIQTAQVQAEDTVKMELEKAIETTNSAKQEAIENIERVGLKVEDKPLIIEMPKTESAITAEGKLSAITETSANIGSIQFLLTKETKYVNITLEELAVDTSVKIVGEIREKKAYAVSITAEPKPQVKEEPEETPETTDEPSEVLDSAPTPTDQQ